MVVSIYFKEIILNQGSIKMIQSDMEACFTVTKDNNEIRLS